MSRGRDEDRRALGAAAAVAVGGAVALVGVAWRAPEAAHAPAAATASLAEAPPAATGAPQDAPSPGSAPGGARSRAFDTCKPPDPIGLGPYGPWIELPLGSLAIPQRGGHDAALGHDLWIHLHGFDAARRIVAEHARGVTYLGVDLGAGSGAYTRPFQEPHALDELVRAVEVALVAHHHDPRAHVRRVGVSAWSAGYGAIVELLRRDAQRLDAVVLLDAPHGSWARGPVAAPGPGDVSLRNLEPLVRFARRAAAGDALLVVTHSAIQPPDYPSTRATADALGRELGAHWRPLARGDDLYGPTREATLGRFFAWGFSGEDEGAHCAHLAHLERALALAEARWETPPLDRSVPPTPAPPRRPAPGTRRSGTIQLELVE